MTLSFACPNCNGTIIAPDILPEGHRPGCHNCGYEMGDEEVEGSVFKFETEPEFSEVYNKMGWLVWVPGDVKAGQRYRVTMEPANPEIGACPCCGGEATYAPLEGRINCLECDLCTRCGLSKAGATEAWNRREGS